MFLCLVNNCNLFHYYSYYLRRIVPKSAVMMSCDLVYIYIYTRFSISRKYGIFHSLCYIIAAQAVWIV